jgi:hypothetical protein
MKTLNNKGGETVYNELKEHIKKGSKLSIISSYFTMYAYYELRNQLNKIDNLRFIYTRPTFTENSNLESKEFFINNDIFGNNYELKLKK